MNQLDFALGLEVMGYTLRKLNEVGGSLELDGVLLDDHSMVTMDDTILRSWRYIERNTFMWEDWEPSDNYDQVQEVKQKLIALGCSIMVRSTEERVLCVVTKKLPDISFSVMEDKESVAVGMACLRMVRELRTGGHNGMPTL